MAQPNPAKRYARTQLKFDAELNRILELAATDIRDRLTRLPLGVGGQVRGAQLRLVLDEIQSVQESMWLRDVSNTIMAGRKAAATAAQDAVEALDRVLYAALPENVAQVVRGGLRASAMAGIESDSVRIPRELSRRVYHDYALTSGQVESTIRAGIIQNLSARELAQSVYRYISPTTPGGASYAASRLARTEINNAFHQQQIKGGQRPGVLACVWNLSGSHGRPDDCNVFASQDSDGLGKGAYKPGNVPGKPHPQCLCYLTYDTMDPDQFAKAITAGKFDDQLNAKIQANMERLGKPAPKVRTLKAVPDQRRTFADRIRGVGEKSSRKLTGGIVGDTRLVTLKDGTKIVRKTTKDGTFTTRSAVAQQDSEELAAMFARKLRVKAPEVVREADDLIAIEFLDGQPAMKALKNKPGQFLNDDVLAERFANEMDQVERARIALFDIISFNHDRHMGNWMVKDGKFQGAIDHGNSWGRGNLTNIIYSQNPFTAMFRGGAFGSLGGSPGMALLTQSDIKFLLDALKSMKDEFTRLGQTQWYNDARYIVNQLKPHAVGVGKGVFG